MYPNFKRELAVSLSGIIAWMLIILAITYVFEILISFFDKKSIDSVLPPQGPPVKTILYVFILSNSPFNFFCKSINNI